MRKLTPILALMLALAGCTLGPDYTRPDIVTPQSWQFESGSAEDTTNTTWWRQFEDPVLDELIAAALESNKDVRIAAARIEEFAARVAITRSSSFPLLDYGGSRSKEQVSRETAIAPPADAGRTSDLFNATVNVGWELDVWGRIRRATEAARAELLAAEEGRRTVLLTLVSSVAVSYIDLRSLDKQLDITLQTLQTRAESLSLFEKQFAGGIISDLELAQVRSEYEQAAVRVPSIERQIALLENSIAVLLGRNPGPIPRGKSLDELTLPRIPSGVPSDVLVRRPDVRQAEQELIAANARIGEAKAAFFPTISLTGFAGHASDDLSNLARSSANIYNIGGSVLGSIFSGGRLSGQLCATEAVQRQTLVGYQQVIQTAFREVEDALVSAEKSHEELAAQGRHVDALMNYARLARARYDNGFVSYIEVLDSERSLFDAELVQVQIQAGLHASLISIYKAMGGGWVMDAEVMADPGSHGLGAGG